MRLRLPPKDEFIDLRSRLNNQQMADHYYVSVPTIKRWAKFYGLEARVVVISGRKTTPNPFVETAIDLDCLLPPPARVVAPPLGEDISLMDLCKTVLGDRMGEDFRGYLLDGRPASSLQVVRAANLPLERRKRPDPTS